MRHSKKSLGIDSLDQQTVLCMFLDAKIRQAEQEMAQAERWHRSNPGPYTAGRAQWLGHKIAALKEARRDADRPGQILARFLKATNKGKESP